MLQARELANQNLNNDFTYYTRQCDEYDFRAVQRTEPGDHNDSDSSFHLLRDGVQLIPTSSSRNANSTPLLQPSTVSKLREYFVHQNKHVPEEAHFPVSQGEGRLSYGLNVYDNDAILIQALHEIHQHAELQGHLQKFFRTHNPAVTELTVMTASNGCSHQTWHMDTKIEGNNLLYARNYLPSLSLFVALQDTTPAMGVTQVVPRSHVCPNDITRLAQRLSPTGWNDLVALSSNHNNSPNQFLPAGSAILLNQHVWHRGTAHSDPNAPDRIQFIVSFMAPPERRFLPKGTYFHQRWNMWGHSFHDLQNATQSFSVWKALGIGIFVKSSGLDLITSFWMRLAHDQLEPEDLVERLIPTLEREFHIPSFLLAKHIFEQENDPPDNMFDEWDLFIRETLDLMSNFALQSWLACQAVIILICAVFALARIRQYSSSPLQARRQRKLGQVLIPHVVLHLALFLFYMLTKWKTLESKWSQNVLNGKKLMSPFPETDEDDFPAITTFPERNDVLFGSRYDDEALLGSYNEWLDHHPGNRKVRSWVNQWKGTDSAANICRENETARQWLLDSWREKVRRDGGRFLLQDWKTGDWTYATETFVRQRLTQYLCHPPSFSLEGHLLDYIHTALAHVRYGYNYRPYPSLRHLTIRLLESMETQVTFASLSSQKMDRTTNIDPSFVRSFGRDLDNKKKTPFVSANVAIKTSASRTTSITHCQLGRRVWYQTTTEDREELLGMHEEEDNEEELNPDIPFMYLPGSIMECQDSKVLVGFVSLTPRWIEYESAAWLEPVRTGTRVCACLSENPFIASLIAPHENHEVNSSCSSTCGRVIRVRPNGWILMDVDDEDWLYLPPSRYYAPPYRYVWWEEEEEEAPNEDEEESSLDSEDEDFVSDDKDGSEDG